MSWRWRCVCGRLALRGLWVICCLACASSLTVLFLSVQYLEDHHQSLKKNKIKKDGAFFDIPSRRRGVKDILEENNELRLALKRLVKLNSGKDVNVALGRFGVPQGRLSPWQDRSLKHVQGEELSVRSLELVSGSQTASEAYGCKEIARIQIVKELGRGYTKITQLGVYNGVEVAVKSVGLDSHDVQTCVMQKRSRVAEDCLVFSRYKIMKELLLYQQLRHANIIKLLGYCLQGDKDSMDIKSRGLTVVTELGTPVDLMNVIQMPWHVRFRIAVGLSRLIHFFSNSPLGSLVIRDFQLTQFVVVEEEIKLSDMDDIGNEPKSCNSTKDCVIGDEKRNITLECFDNQCQGFNERWNVYNLYRFYFALFLMPGAPEHISKDLKKVQDGVALLNCDSKCLVQGMERVLEKLRNGVGLSPVKSTTRYKAVPHADFPGQHDYECFHSWSMVNCQFFTFSEDEAKQRCNDDPQCKAIVLSYKRTWIGYRSAYLKSNSSNLVFSAENIVYIKIT